VKASAYSLRRTRSSQALSRLEHNAHETSHRVEETAEQKDERRRNDSQASADKKGMLYRGEFDAVRRKVFPGARIGVVRTREPNCDDGEQEEPIIVAESRSPPAS
jgi:hypothetical protein